MSAVLPPELSDLINKSDKTIEQKIVEELLNQNNLSAKTDLSKPMVWAVLQLIQSHLKDHKMFGSSELIERFIENCFKLLISKDRKGRLEYLDALKGLKSEVEQQKVTQMGVLK